MKMRRKTALFAACMILSTLFIAAGEGEDCASGTYEFDTWPVRNNGHITDFKLCELDRKTLEPLSDCLPAKVPGDVFTSLMEAGRIPDPYIDMNSKEVQWVDDRAWLYMTEFEYEKVSGKRLWLQLTGLDYKSRIDFNGQTLVPHHEGMFSRVDLDVTEHLDQDGTQELRIIFFGMGGPSGITAAMANTFGYENQLEMRDNLKTPMSTGWDFSPELKGAGIKDGVFTYETGPIRIKDIFARPHLDGRVDVTVELDGKLPDINGETSELILKIDGLGFESGIEERKTLNALDAEKESVFDFTLNVPTPKLWWPWDMGEQNLYTVTATVISGSTSDHAGDIFGFREYEWKPAENAPKDWPDWVLYVNGKRAFIRGANWVPPEAMYGRGDKKRYLELNDMAKEANINMLRIWGGGNRENRCFYDYCDQNGIMVWQEFPYACVFVTGYSRSKKYKEVARQEVEEIVRQLRNHPSLIMWCGGNEFNIKQNRHVVKIMRRAVSELDPTRRFIASSPVKGDSHNWVVWHSKGNLKDYFEDRSAQVSEFGLQSYPAVSTLEKYISSEYLMPVDNDVYVHHSLGPSKMDKYVSAIEHGDSLAAYVQASQKVQAHYMKRGIEHWRQSKYETAGTAFWMFNDPWPAVSWSVIDYELNKKEAYYAIKQAYQPVLVTAAYDDRKWGPGDDFKAEIMVVNDLHERFDNSKITAGICGAEGPSFEVDVTEDSVLSAGILERTIPEDCEEPVLTLTMTKCEEELSSSFYELWIHDPKSAGKLGRLSTDIGHAAMTGVYPERWEKR